MSCLRYAHALRASLSRDKSTPRLQAWKVSRGKARKREAFFTAVPTYVQKDVSLFEDLQRFLETQMGPNASEHLIPDIRVGKDGLAGEYTLLAQGMPYSRFILLIRLVLEDTYAHIPTYTSYSYRRYLPTVCQNLGFDVEKRRDLGNWQDCIK